MEKAERLWQSLQEVSGKDQPFPKEAIADLFAHEQEFIDREPDRMIVCSVCGNYERNADIDLIGVCRWCRHE